MKKCVGVGLMVVAAVVCVWLVHRSGRSSPDAARHPSPELQPGALSPTPSQVGVSNSPIVGLTFVGHGVHTVRDANRGGAMVELRRPSIIRDARNTPP